jgi:hypothetical protein
MRDKGWIVLGLLVFLALVTFPVWYNLASGESPRPPDLLLPENEPKCVAETEFMRTNHMQLLMDWRDEVVRDNQRIFTTDDGRRYYKSLSGTCMSCHNQKQEFCGKCHDFVGATPYCWDCHLEPMGEL